MTEVLQSLFPSSTTTNSSSTTSPSPSSPPICCAPPLPAPGHISQNGSQELDQERDLLAKKQLSLLALLLTLFRKSLLACKSDRRDLCAMEIGWPTNVRHVAHVTYDRFNGFLGLPVELEPEVPRRPPSASATVFGVSTESMQLSYDSRGNCVPTILLLMQRCLYGQGGLQAEGIFRINAENSQEEFVRDQLNSGVVPEGIDVHCLAGLIKAWFRELPMGILDPLSPEQVMQCQSEEDCAELVRHLPPTEAALLDWAINLMADVVQQEHLNKMNARNIAMVFAPNMTQMADPLTALMYAVQVMNFLQTLILRTLREREDSILDPTSASRPGPYDENDHKSPLQYRAEENSEDNEKTEQHFEEPFVERSSDPSQSDAFSGREDHCSTTSIGNFVANEEQSQDSASHTDMATDEINNSRVNSLEAGVQAGNDKGKVGQSSNPSCRKASCRLNRQQSLLSTAVPVEKTRGISNLSRLDSRIERIEAWR